MIEIVKFDGVSQYFEVLLKKKVKSSKKKTWSVKDISFSLKKGEVLGIVGDNGAGKTTLLRLIGGILYPDKGKIKRLVDPIAVLDLGAGFKEELTGSENIFLSAMKEVVVPLLKLGTAVLCGSLFPSATFLVGLPFLYS